MFGKTEMLLVGQVVETHLNNEGLPMYVVADFGGNYIYPVIQMSLIGGVEGSFSCSAVRNGSRVIVARISETYYILGGIADSEDAECFSADGIKTAIDAEVSAGKYDRVSPDIEQEREVYELNTDYTDVHLDECHLENDDNFINMSAVHGLTLEGSPRVSVQIPDDDQSIFRVSAGGNASNRVLNADPFLDKLFAYIQQMEAKIRAIETYCITLQGALAALNVAPLTPVGAAASTAAPQLGTVTSAQLDTAASVKEQVINDINGKILIP